ncbi:unnamed protein product [Allacma fusca]|uniref:Uncharacterized protein n=1 Tax=Allacma fusca TaxID=39272 RepID=A0A8J2P1G5_9HEXA|nr:unnamed protein product [Allacma fusca]
MDSSPSSEYAGASPVLVNYSRNNYDNMQGLESGATSTRNPTSFRTNKTRSRWKNPKLTRSSKVSPRSVKYEPAAKKGEVSTMTKRTSLLPTSPQHLLQI